MKITDFDINDISNAQKLVIENYQEERSVNELLPKISAVDGLEELAKSGLGVAMYEGEEMLGFMSALVSDRFEFKRAYCPAHGHGAVKKGRDKIYSRLYQAAAQKWVNEQALTHEITVFYNDRIAKEAFFNNVFGACVIHAVMDLDKTVINQETLKDIEMFELPLARYGEVRDLHNGLFSHLRKSPVFLPYSEETEESFAKIEGKRYFTAEKDGKLIAHIRVQENADSLIAKEKDTISISGAFMYPEFRGSGIYSNLLGFFADSMKKEGYKRISVDFETYNPNAMRFWTKNFTPYTLRLTRKIEPMILKTPEF